jgi:hypothetical protein
MKCDRFFHFLWFLHFTDNNSHLSTTDPAYDRLWKMRTISDTLRDTYAKFYSPFEHLAIDEVTVLFKGWVIFMQYIPKNRNALAWKFTNSAIPQVTCMTWKFTWEKTDRLQLRMWLLLVHQYESWQDEWRVLDINYLWTVFFFSWFVWRLSNKTDKLLWHC